MKYALAIAAFAAVARAQSACLASAAAIPPCALGYLADAANSINSCDIVDFQCQCSVSASVQNAIAATVAQQCGGSLTDVLASASALCACASSNSGTVEASPSACLPSAAAIPACALGYLASAAGAIGSCSVNDFACQCSNSAAVQGSIAQNVASACGGDINAVIASAGALCSCVSANGAGGGGGSGSSPAATATGSGSSPSSGGTTAAPSGSAAPGGGSSKTGGVSVFTGAGATGAAFLPVGGVMGAMVGLLAVL